MTLSVLQSFKSLVHGQTTNLETIAAIEECQLLQTGYAPLFVDLTFLTSPDLHFAVCHALTPYSAVLCLIPSCICHCRPTLLPLKIEAGRKLPIPQSLLLLSTVSSLKTVFVHSAQNTQISSIYGFLPPANHLISSTANQYPLSGRSKLISTCLQQ
jgi:hypothetical protein